MADDGTLKIGVLLAGKLAKAMTSEREKTMAPYSAIARAALVEYFERRGYDVDDNVIWGGSRQSPASPQSEDETQVMAVRASMRL